MGFKGTAVLISEMSRAKLEPRPTPGKMNMSYAKTNWVGDCYK